MLWDEAKKEVEKILSKDLATCLGPRQPKWDEVAPGFLEALEIISVRSHGKFKFKMEGTTIYTNLAGYDLLPRINRNKGDTFDVCGGAISHKNPDGGGLCFSVDFMVRELSKQVIAGVLNGCTRKPQKNEPR